MGLGLILSFSMEKQNKNKKVTEVFLLNFRAYIYICVYKLFVYMRRKIIHINLFVCLFVCMRHYKFYFIVKMLRNIVSKKNEKLVDPHLKA